MATYVIARGERYLEVEYDGQPAEWTENIKDAIHYDAIELFGFALQ